MWEPLTYEVLRKKLFWHAIKLAFQKGPIGLLLFCWAVASTSLIALFHQPLLALVVSGIWLMAGLLSVRDYVRRPTIREQVIESFIRGRHGLGETPMDLKERLHASVTYMAEIAKKIVAAYALTGEHEYLDQVLGNADGMLALQREFVRQMQESKRILALVTPRSSSPPLEQGRSADQQTQQLHQKNIGTLEGVVTDAEASVEKVRTQLATLLLQLVQVTARPGATIEVRQSASQARMMLEQLQRVVESQREAVDEMTHLFEA